MNEPVFFPLLRRNSSFSFEGGTVNSRRFVVGVSELEKMKG